MSRPRRLLFSVLTLLLFLAAAEGVARLLPQAAAEPAGGASLQFSQNPELQEGNARFWRTDPYLFWRMRPDLDVDFGGMALRTNSGGFRDGPHLRRPGAPLVICLGDSTTFGWGVLDENERFSDRLQALLEEDRGAPVQVFNFGQSGYSTVQGLRLLEEEALGLEPDVVVLLFGPNDYARATGRADADQPVAAPHGATARAQSWLHHSAFYRRLAAALVSLRDQGAETEPTSELSFSDDPSGPGLAGESDAAAGILRRVPLDAFRRNLHAMVSMTRAAGAAPVLVTYPRRPLNPLLPCPAPRDPEQVAAWRERVADLAAPFQDLVARILANQPVTPEEALAAWRDLPAQNGAGSATHLYGEAWLLQRASPGQAAQAPPVAAAAVETTLASASRQAAADGCGLDLFSMRLFRYLEEPAAAAYNDVIRQVANADGVALVDAAAMLAEGQMALAARTPDDGEAWRTRLLGRWFGSDSYFVDVVHPSARGHALIAAALDDLVGDDLSSAGD